MKAALIAVALLFALPAGAVEPDEILADPVLEQRAREISKNLRCLVCQNQSIDDSNAELARDLRILVRQRLVAGDTDEEVTQFVVARYGDFVLLEPPFKATTYALWFGPAVIFTLAAFALVVLQRRRARVEAKPLSPAERRRLDSLLDDGSDP
ncbi:MAG: cytochrome c-type biogenesis protein CcmH [Alphaproteobacteria bacterium]